MHGLFCKSLEEFVRHGHGSETWARICAQAGSEVSEFEMLRLYDDAMISGLVMMTARELQVWPAALLEDIGHWVCTHPPLEPVRRLIRFSGRTFPDLLYALEDVHDRARIALPSLDLPHISLVDRGGGQFRILCNWQMAGGGALLTGVLRAMADDYGMLATIERNRDHAGRVGEEEVLVQIFDPSFQTPRQFTLGPVA